MKKIVILLIFSFLLAGSAQAASFSLTPSKFSAVPGRTFDLTVKLNPEGVKNYTTKLVMNFPPKLLSVKSFKFSDEWLPLNQSGYDLLDNNDGLLIKTAGFPKGTDKAVTFGVVTFYVKKAGSGTILLQSGSLSYNALGENLLSGLPIEREVNINEAKKQPPKVEAPASRIQEADLEEEIGETADILIPSTQIPEETVVREEPTLFDIEIKPAPPEKQNNFSLPFIILLAVILLSLAVYWFLGRKRV